VLVILFVSILTTVSCRAPWKEATVILSVEKLKINLYLVVLGAG